jgi:hypothetical protein
MRHGLHGEPRLLRQSARPDRRSEDLDQRSCPPGMRRAAPEETSNHHVSAPPNAPTLSHIRYAHSYLCKNKPSPTFLQHVYDMHVHMLSRAACTPVLCTNTVSLKRVTTGYKGVPPRLHYCRSRRPPNTLRSAAPLRIPVATRVRSRGARLGRRRQVQRRRSQPWTLPRPQSVPFCENCVSCSVETSRHR